MDLLMQVGLSNAVVATLLAVIAPNLASAFGVFLMRQYIVGSVPNELIDAARVDGCYTFGVFRHVVWPAVRPVAAVLGLLTFMTTWNDFFWPLVVLSPRNPTVQVAVSTLASGYVSSAAPLVSNAAKASTQADSIRDAAQTRLSNLTGVNLDEETAQLTQLQTQYQANAQMISMARDLFTTLLTMVNS